MAKVQIKSEKLTPFGGIFSIMEQFMSPLSSFHVPQKCHHMILHNTDALHIADTHVVHRHQISFKSLLTILVRRFTFLFHFCNLNLGAKVQLLF